MLFDSGCLVWVVVIDDDDYILLYVLCLFIRVDDGFSLDIFSLLFVFVYIYIVLSDWLSDY